jgi:hypothetical protein
MFALWYGTTDLRRRQVTGVHIHGGAASLQRFHVSSYHPPSVTDDATNSTIGLKQQRSHDETHNQRERDIIRRPQRRFVQHRLTAFDFVAARLQGRRQF